MVDFKEIVEKMASDILADNSPEKIDQKLIESFVEDKKDYLEKYDEWDYAQSVAERIEMLLQGEDYEEYWKDKELLTDNKKKTEQDAEQDTEQDIEQNIVETEQTPSETEQTVKKSQKTERQGKLWEFSCNAGMLKDITKKIKPISNEIPLHLTKQKLVIQAVDDSHVAMVKLEIPRKNFYTGNSCVNKEVHYTLHNDDLEIGVELEKLDKTLRLFDNVDKIEGWIENNHLHLKHDDYDGKMVYKKISLLDIDGMPHAKMPELQHSVKAEVSCLELHTLKKAVENEDYICLLADEKDLRAIVEDDEDSLTMTLAKEKTGQGRCLYSSDYLKSILDVFGGSFYYKIDVSFSTDNPIQFEGKIGDNGSFLYLLAPRIESEEFEG